MSEYTLISTITSTLGGKYRILKPTIFYVGFIGYFWQIIRGIYKYPNDKYYIYMGNPNENLNIWDFYFEQPHTNTKPPHPEIISEVGIIFDDESEFVDLYPSMLKLTNEERQARRKKFGEIVKKYFVLKPEIQEKLDTFKSKHFNGKRVLGYHHRGTDHPDRQDIEKMFPFIDAELQNYDILFASSDEMEIINKIKEYYKDKVVCYDSTTRSAPCNFQMDRTPSDAPGHIFRYNSLINWSKQNDGYKIGEDAIIECYLLASTQFLLCACNSNVNYFIRVINPDLPYKTIYIPTI